MKEKRRIVITGVGPLSAIGFGKNSFWNCSLQGKTGLVKFSRIVDNRRWNSFWVHMINSFEVSNFGINARLLRDVENWKEGQHDRDLDYLLAAVQLALDDSGLKYDTENNNIGLFITDEHPSFEPFCERIILETLAYLKNNLPTSKKFSKKKLLEYLYTKNFKEGYNLQTFMYLNLVAKVFGFHGFSLYNNDACA